MIFGGILQSLATAAPINAEDVRVIDGDTIRVFRTGPNVRLVGFNAPEIRARRWW
jgi:endonuclease YncB( thermonuclease family)